MKGGVNPYAVGLFTIMLWIVNAACAGEYSLGLESEPLTISRAIGHALEHNPVLRAAKQDVHASGQQVRQAWSDYFPKLDSSYALNHMSEEPFAIFESSVGSPVKVQTSHQTTNRWEVVVSQPLFTGFNLKAQTNISKIDFKIAEYRLEETRLNLIRDVEHAFYQAILGDKLVQVARDNVESLEIQRRNAQANFEQGLVARNDVLKADVALAQARQTERTASKQLVILLSRLNQLLNIEMNAKLTLAEEDIPLRQPPQLTELYALAEKQRPEYLTFEESIRRARESITAAKSRYYPHVSAFAQYFREGKDFLAEENDFTNNDNAAIGLRVDMNLFEGGKTDAAIKELRYRQSALEERRRDLRQQIQLQVRDAYEQLQVARANIDASETALRQAQENERMTTLQYKEQLVIFLEVLNAQVFIAQSKADYYQALYGFQLAWADLERAIGGPIQPLQGRAH